MMGEQTTATQNEYRNVLYMASKKYGDDLVPLIYPFAFLFTTDSTLHEF
jgi:hypothetical protein